GVRPGRLRRRCARPAAPPGAVRASGGAARRGPCSRRRRCAVRSRDGKKKYVLRHVDACETTLNPGFKWGRLVAFGLPARGRTCTPGFHRVPVVVVKGQGECLRTPSITAEDATAV